MKDCCELDLYLKCWFISAFILWLHYLPCHSAFKVLMNKIRFKTQTVTKLMTTVKIILSCF